MSEPERIYTGQPSSAAPSPWGIGIVLLILGLVLGVGVSYFLLRPGLPAPMPVPAVPNPASTPSKADATATVKEGPQPLPTPGAPGLLADADRLQKYLDEKSAATVWGEKLKVAFDVKNSEVTAHVKMAGPPLVLDQVQGWAFESARIVGGALGEGAQIRRANLEVTVDPRNKDSMVLPLAAARAIAQAVRAGKAGDPALRDEFVNSCDWATMSRLAKETWPEPAQSGPPTEDFNAMKEIQVIEGAGPQEAPPFSIKKHWEIRWQTPKTEGGEFVMTCVDDEVPSAIQPLAQKPGDGFHMMEKAGTYHLSIKGNVKWSVMVLQYMKLPKEALLAPAPK